MNLAIPDELIEELAQRISDKLREQIPSQPTTTSPWLTASEAATYIGCGKRRIYDLAGANRIPLHREGSRLLFRRDELDGWIVSGAATFEVLEGANLPRAATALPPLAENPETRALSEAEITRKEGVSNAAK